ncbi:hypothetical protein [Vibrio gazogenes]|uniref:Uncharacterized protein n=1 Tax=Vibrio gazogenes DSM 21264 = NBRC 103151 TaxID=1123492 RepID=A0A1M5F8C9_VIBGA|nr:hypothetical protein [Vibrio gazogenes]USP15453.1 hypothetical protein MKS89_18820 [Vibrio gazogenes]SHF87843.1 hypothetical protein SAMN02745781_03392 [Vibrio gazogenes DSM 21264] [Vibrio gazogenes DSM 21264 = NBRC 103151]SJN54523.1 hypothetical protein BQ6471_01055 [Vibrio gazogenes]
MGRLYNWQFAKQQGKAKRLEAEMNALTKGVPVPAKPPLFSHDATLQSHFNIAWQRVSQCEINMHVGKARTPQASDLIENIKEFRECHFPS